VPSNLEHTSKKEGTVLSLQKERFSFQKWRPVTAAKVTTPRSSKGGSRKRNTRLSSFSEKSYRTERIKEEIQPKP
jgi:hypothetical protein